MCLVSWPAQLAADPSPRQQYTHAVDIVPTVYELLGIEPPATIKGYQQHPIEGESFATALTDTDAPGKTHAVLHDARATLALSRGLARQHRSPAAVGVGQLRPGRMGAVSPRNGPGADPQRRSRTPRTGRVDEEPVVLLRRHLQRAAAR